MSGWQPIETAPKDGTLVILTDGERVGPGSYLSNGYWTGYSPMLTLASHPSVVLDWDYTPTGWQSWPPPPPRPLQTVCYSFGSEWFGSDGIVAGMTDVGEGRASHAHFAIADHPKHGETVYGHVIVGRARDGSWRYCGEDFSLDSDSSWPLADPGELQCFTTAVARVTARCFALAADRANVFRQRVLEGVNLWPPGALASGGQMIDEKGRPPDGDGPVS